MRRAKWGAGEPKLRNATKPGGAKGLTAAGLPVLQMEMIGDGVTQRVIYHCIDKNGGKCEIDGNEWEQFVRNNEKGKTI
jgi:hypothetical protein